MLFRDIVNLIQVVYTEDDIGNHVETDTVSDFTWGGTDFTWDTVVPWGQVSSRTVYADKKSIRQSEFYQAQATGLKPDLMFVVRSVDYNNETKLVYDSKRYNIIRAFDKNGEFVELICQGIVGTEVR
jgi:SPP1 family predicted phage head-tail adaptor